MKKQLKNLLKFRSIFTGLYVVYSSILLLFAVVLGLVLTQNVSQIILKADMDNNSKQINSLDYAFQSQCDNLKSSLRKMYTLQIEKNKLVCDEAEYYLTSNDSYSDESYTHSYQVLSNYIWFDETPSEKGLNLFLLTGRQWKYSDIFYSAFQSGLSPMAYISSIMSAIYQNKGNNDQTVCFQPAVTVRSGSASDKVYALYGFLRDQEDLKSFYGYIVTAFTVQNLSTKMENAYGKTWSKYFILTNTGGIMYSSNGQGYGKVFEDFSQIAEMGEKDEENIQTKDSIIYVKKNAEYNYYVVSKVDAKGLYQDVHQNNRFILTITVLCCILAVFLTSLLTRVVLQKIHPLLRTMDKAKSGDLSARAPVSPNGNEFDTIAKSFNGMMDKINDYIRLKYISEIMQKSAELKQKESELYALQTQINPHFLYNTLEIIRMKAVTNQDEETASLIRMLATIFRSRTKNRMAITIGEEISFCRSLLELYCIRFDGELNYDFKIDGSISEYAILKDLLQPLIENAVVHGLRFGMKTNEESQLTVEAKRSGETDLLFSVSDNGEGIDSDQLNQLNQLLGSVNVTDIKSITENQHIGLINVQQRIKLTFGNAYGIHISSSSGGTTIEMRIRAMSVEELLKATKSIF